MTPTAKRSTKFSSRHGLDPKQPKELVFDSAPEWLRSIYLSDVLDPLTYMDMDHQLGNNEGRPLGIKRLHEKFCAIIREETIDCYYDSNYAWEYLGNHLKACEWYQFYDFVELVVSEIEFAEEENFLERDPQEKFGFEAYRNKVNDLFKEEKIGWRLSSRGELVREQHAVLQKRIEVVEDRLIDEYSPARAHYKKAHRFLVERPPDPENCIKEIVSAVESVTKVAYPKSSTLGVALKEMRKSNGAPAGLINVIEKFYAYASAEPAVRHGALTSSSLQQADAELAFHMGVSFIRYLIDLHKEQK